MSLLTEELKKLGFHCGIEFQVYTQDTGKYTSLIIEGNRQAGQAIYTYDFYKVTFYPNYTNRVTIYGEHLTPFQLLKRVKNYIYYREKYLKQRRTTT
ncbi:hypothetical protein [Pseudogracilibacillus sp. SO30301A]|uniref:hypothetical protein n=1 Tax=Pseudogracilibacillus sp. SO30301A TaxID=3098291 RepID=UPI00300DE9DD